MSKNCFLCGGQNFTLIEAITSRPVRETDFKIPSNTYFREIKKCIDCGIYNNFHDFDFSELYTGVYNESTYQNNIVDKYNKIMELPFDKSDNKQRVKRILDFLLRNNIDAQTQSVLDIGSGLCVFLGALKGYVKRTVALDPDKLSTVHAKETAKVDGIIHGLMGQVEINENFDLITLNKVLEHVIDPVSLLTSTSNHLNPNGIIYIELPDGKSALENNLAFDREEFFIEHYTIFDSISIQNLTKRSQLEIIELGAIHEPSDKYTLYAFLKKKV